jgi:hypothetical protein
VSADEPRDEGSGESFRARRDSSGPIPEPADDTSTSIIRRTPSGPIPELSDDTRTSIIRRQTSGPIPQLADDAPTNLVATPGTDDATGIIRQRPQRIAGKAPPPAPSAATAITAAAISIVNGWSTAVIATDLVTAWWHTDRLFCVGVGFLTAVFAASTIAGAVALLLRRRVGIYLTLVGALMAVLIFAGIFVAGAHVAGVVRAIPVLPAATALFVLMPATWRWTRGG